jgi:hypothetical protein
MRYWLSTGDGTTQGPYELAQIRQMHADGRINATAQVCAEGSTTWMPMMFALESGGQAGALPPHATPLPAQPLGAAFAPVSYVGPILTTVCCCLLGGLVSIIYAANANSKGAAGDFVGAQRAAKLSRNWMIASMIGGILVGLVYIAADIARGGRP